MEPPVTHAEEADVSVSATGTLSTQSRATLADVGRLAGVSAKTVSRVVLGSTNVSDSTRDRVMAAARTLRFRPNHLARNLRHGSVTNTVGFVIGDLRNPFYFNVAAGIERELAGHGMMMILAATDDDPNSEARVVETLLTQRVRALLMVPVAEDQSYLEGERQLGTPVVCIDRPAQNLIADSVVLENRGGTAEAVRALIAAGHRRIGFVCSPGGLFTHQQRLAGYRDALREVGVTDTAQWELLGDERNGVSEDSVQRLLATEGGPTALLAGNNRASATVIRAVHNHFTEVAFIGFDDFELADASDISVVAYDPVELGRRAAQLAIQRLSEPLGLPRHIEIPTHLIRRGSGERAAPGI